MKKVFAKKGVICFSLFTLSLFTTPAVAQDAFYIYRNDGDFDGFFYDNVIRMGYSKIDPQGVEHEEYVIQGSRISVKTLDLNRPFDEIRLALDGIVQERFQPQ